MQVSEVTALQYKDGPQMFIPDTLIHTDSGGRRWLKLRASSPTIAKLVLGHMEKFKKVANPSLAASPQLKKIQDKVKAAVLGSQEFQDNGKDLFGALGEEDAEAESKDKGKKALKDCLQKAPPIVEVDLGEQRVALKTPKSWKESDIFVPLEPESLTAVCDFICEDLGQEKKRVYNRTGNFTNKKLKGNDQE